VDAETGYGNAGLDPRAALPGKFNGEYAGIEPAITLAEASVHDVTSQVGETPQRLGAIQQLDIVESPTALAGDQIFLRPGSVIGSSNEEVSLMPNPDVDALLQVIEECDALTDQLDLLDVVELQPKCAGGDRRGERSQRRTLFEDNRDQAGALGKKGGRATDDAAADDDEVGGLGR
jgi:hypothetical protein